MKKEERLHRLFGDIDDGLVAEATRRPVRKAVWVPIVAAAACVALTVGLWQRGVFSPADISVETPDESTTTEVTEPTDTTAVTDPTDVVTDPTDTTADTTTTTTEKSTTTEKPTTGSTAKPTTTTTTEPYILVGGEDDLSSSPHDSSDGYPSLKRRFISPTLEEKMKEYCDVNAVFQVGVMSAYTIEDDKEISNFLKTDEEYQSLKKQRKAASEAYKEAKKHYEDCEYPDDDPRREDLKRKMNELRNELRDLLVKIADYDYKIVRNRMEERLSYAAQYSITEPVSGFGLQGKGYYMQLTADAINELADRGGYDFFLASKLDRYRLGFFNE